MKYISNEPYFAKIVKGELDADTESKWFHPKQKVDKGADAIAHFAQGRMRFVNKNLNYFYFKSMISLALQNNYEFNPHYAKTLEFCNYIRGASGETGPFGRMCLWKLTPHTSVLPHYDNWPYHRQINRYILCIGTQASPEIHINIQNEVVNVQQGTVFMFNPDRELHEFTNNSDNEWNFLGFDFWDPEKLKTSAQETGVTAESVIQYTPGYGRDLEKFTSPE